MFTPFHTISLAALAIALPTAAQAQDYADLPPLAPMGAAQVDQLPADMRAGPVMAPQPSETVSVVDGVETITRTRFITAPVARAAVAPAPQASYPAPYYAGQAYGYAPAYGAPVVFERDQWIDECRRRTRGQNRDNTGAIIGGLLGAIAGGVAGYEIAGAGDRVLGTALGVGGGSLLGGLLGSLFGGERRKNLYDCEAALDTYLSGQPMPATRIASRQIPAPYGYAAPAAYPGAYPYNYGYAYAPQSVVMVAVETQVPQQVVVRETVREESYSVPGATRIIEDSGPRPSPKLIKQR
ncbi:hypothetical protein [Erythrobacter neustonensis]|uniref:17 kDa surface antigen n=1 Tax=Erythrobacter neustonensis TaxID=1112 RepID=A0A192D2U8_9SPHN|nr:hypothetical protein [Erythrobacter neustonensis]ANK12321.1 hypothetical protein A9D12_04460 [Erythrobacter neustonensis]